MKKYFVFFLLSALGYQASNSQQLYIDPVKGKDNNPGSADQPLKTLMEAAHRVNGNKEKAGTEIILKEGLHVLTETALFTNNKYTVENRLVIRAELMPDDAGWMPQRMPRVITLVPMHPSDGGEQGNGIQVEVNHVTIEGIRFTGSPDYSLMTDKRISRSYPIWRQGKNLDDLLVSQCMFTGSTDVMPLHLGVIANGHGLILEHCVFYNCKNSVVFWDAEGGTSNRNAMRNCLVYGASFSGLWTTTNTNGEDFDFRNNIIANGKTAWIREAGSTKKYKASDCIFAVNTNLSGFGTAASAAANATNLDFLTKENVRTDGTIQIEMDQSKKNYLQLVSGSYGSELKAGLFKK